MKKLLMIITLVFFYAGATAQEDLYLVFEFMHVDNEQERAYAETETFWEKIHEQRVKNGDVLGWDLWRISPGGENQGSQYMTVNLYNDQVKMMQGGDFDKALTGAYPDMSDAELTKKMEHTAKSRDLTHRVFLKQIATTTPEYDMPIGMVARINFMKVAPGNFEAYEKAEQEIFQPSHQQGVDNGRLASWGLMRNMLGYGSESYASHITVDMFTGYDQMFNAGGGAPAPTEAQQKAIQDGLATRDMKSVRIIELIRKVRPQTE